MIDLPFRLEVEKKNTNILSNREYKFAISYDLLTILYRSFVRSDTPYNEKKHI